MNKLFRLLATVILTSGALSAQSPRPARKARTDEPSYALGPDSIRQPNVPQGTVFNFVLAGSRIFPGTTRKITVYVPAQYRGDQPACVHVDFGFSLGFNIPVVFDNLIAKGAMPVTIAIDVAPGEVDSIHPGENPRFNRDYEFDGLNDNLERFILEEVFPEVERRKTPDGKPILLSKKPDDHAVSGSSSGAIAAFTLAWEHPEAFRRVFTAIGTFVGMRGGDRYPVLVRKTEPKPIRIFMQDGSRNQWPGGPEFGDWWMSNQTMQRALSFAGYAVEHVWGEGSHNSQQGSAIFPDAVRWLWKDWPQPVAAGHSQNRFLNYILIDGQDWEAVTDQTEIPSFAPNTTRTAEGRTYSTVTAAGEVWLTQANGKRALLDSGLKAPTAIALSPDNLWLAVAENHSHWGYVYRVEADGTVQNKQRFYWFHVPDTADDSGVTAWVPDRDGRLYATTRMGVQIFDRNGRVRVILPVPGGDPTAVAFGGKEFDLLYVRNTEGTVYRRQVKTHGLPAGAPPIKLSPGSAG